MTVLHGPSRSTPMVEADLAAFALLPLALARTVRLSPEEVAMSDDMRLVPLDDDVELPESAEVVLDGLTEAAPEVVPAVALESRDWSEQGFEPNNYNERPPHWED